MPLTVTVFVAGVENLDGDRAVEFRVEGFVNQALTAAPDETQQFVIAESFTDVRHKFSNPFKFYTRYKFFDK